MSARRRGDNDRTVWSSERGDLRSPRSRPRDEAAVIANDGVVRVRRETKGRGGKTVTAISGVPLPEPELRDLAKDLKRRCGTGGALKDNVIEIQGDHRDTLVAELEARGYTVNRG
ncbi:MAG: translation initiation factor [Deltaproteobacteria bacterium]|nr:translation initiation factor [Deltaproteobacteria bacterium]MBW2396342.1 translation initiation factor [Deltaproteobacteria bacterium]